MGIIERIEQNEKEILSGKIPESQKECKKCFKTPNKFKIHEYKSRILLVIVSQVVKKINTCLLRIKCPECCKTFIIYPDFVLPYKRYIKYFIFNFCQTYIETDKTYNSVVKKDDSGIAYETPDNLRSVELAASSVHRWITYLGSFSLCIKNVLKLIKEKDPCSVIHRAGIILSPLKYKSQNRKEELENAFQVIQAEKEFKRVFNKSAIPRFGIKFENMCVTLPP